MSVPVFIFAQYVLMQLLRSAGWPRKTGFLRSKPVVDANVVDMAVCELVHIAVALGVGRPSLAVRLLADTFEQRDWSRGSATEFLDSLDPNSLVSANPDKRPWEVIAPAHLAETGLKSLPWEALGDDRLSLHFTGGFAQGLIWGLLDPEEAEDALNEQRVRYEKESSFWQAQGLEISAQYPWASNEDYYRNCEEIVDSFVRERRPLVDTPRELRAEPRLSQFFG